jgi:hypothetical protein
MSEYISECILFVGVHLMPLALWPADLKTLHPSAAPGEALRGLLSLTNRPGVPLLVRPSATTAADGMCRTDYMLPRLMPARPYAGSWNGSTALYLRTGTAAATPAPPKRAYVDHATDVLYSDFVSSFDAVAL